MKKVYIVLSRWANSEVLESNASVLGVFSSKTEAIDCYKRTIKEEMNNCSLAQSPDLVVEEFNNTYSMWEEGRYFDNHYEIKIEERFLSTDGASKFIDILEKKQTEDSEDYPEGTFEEGWLAGFNMAIQLVKENKELFM